MGRDIRCPHCKEIFLAGGEASEIHCPACGKGIRLRAAAPAAPGGAPPAKGTSPAARAAAAIQRICPDCGERLEARMRECPGCGVSYRAAKSARDARRETEAGLPVDMTPERKGIDKGVLGGLVMIAIAVAWFGIGWLAGRIFFYPPILLLIGLFAVVKGLATGNYDGKKPAPRRRKP